VEALRNQRLDRPDRVRKGTSLGRNGPNALEATALEGMQEKLARSKPMSAAASGRPRCCSPAADEVVATVILERLLHHVHVMNIDGRSYRLRELQGLLKGGASSAMPWISRAAQGRRACAGTGGERPRCVPRNRACPAAGASRSSSDHGHQGFTQLGDTKINAPIRGGISDSGGASESRRLRRSGRPRRPAKPGSTGSDAATGAPR
jgi:hypothetical protein